MAMNAGNLEHIPLDPLTDSATDSARPRLSSAALLPQSRSCETSRWRQSLNPAQFATLDALARLLAHAAVLPFSPVRRLPFPPTPPAPLDHVVGLDELDDVSRTRAGYAFAELPIDLQEAVLSLVASRDLTSRKIDLALWLEDLLRHPPSHLRGTV